MQRALAVRPDDPGTLNNLGNALAGNKKQPAAIECFQQVQRLTPGHAASHYNMGRALAELDRLDEAVTSFHAALANAPAATEPGRLADIRAALGHALGGLRSDASMKRSPNVVQSRPLTPASRSETRA